MKTYKQLIEIDQEVAQMYNENPLLKEGKFGYGYGRFHSKNIKPINIKLTEELQDLFVKYALEDPTTKALIIKDGNYEYSKQSKLDLLKEQRVLMEKYDNTEIEIDPYFIEMEDLSEERKELFKGVLIKE